MAPWAHAFGTHRAAALACVIAGNGLSEVIWSTWAVSFVGHLLDRLNDIAYDCFSDFVGISDDGFA